MGVGGSERGAGDYRIPGTRVPGNIQIVKKFSDISLMLKSKEVKRFVGPGTCEGTVNISIV